MIVITLLLILSSVAMSPKKLGNAGTAVKKAIIGAVEKVGNFFKRGSSGDESTTRLLKSQDDITETTALETVLVSKKVRGSLDTSVSKSDGLTRKSSYVSSTPSETSHESMKTGPEYDLIDFTTPPYKLVKRPEHGFTDLATSRVSENSESEVQFSHV